MVKRTYHAIIDAFNRLIEVRPFEDITVADIIEEAEVSPRSTATSKTSTT